MDKTKLIKILNTFFNPLEYRNEKVLRVPGQTPRQQVLTRGASLGLGLGSLAALARLTTRPETGSDRQEELRAWAGSRFPVMSVDPSTRDPKREQKLRSVGVPDDPEEVPELSKEAENADSATPTRFLKQPLSFLNEIATGNFSVDEPAVALMASLGGVYGGYKLADYIKDVQRKEELNDEVQKKRNEIDKLIYNEYLRTRGIQKGAGEIMEAGAGKKEFYEQPIRGTSRVLGAGYGVFAALSLALAYKYSKQYHDKNDPARARMKQLQEVARERARQRQAPVMLEAGALPDIEAGSRKVQAAPPKKPVAITTSPGTGRTPADPSDPLGSLLG